MYLTSKNLAVGSTSILRVSFCSSFNTGNQNEMILTVLSLIFFNYVYQCIWLFLLRNISYSRLPSGKGNTWSVLTMPLKMFMAKDFDSYKSKYEIYEIHDMKIWMNYGNKIMIYTLKVEDKSVDNKDQSIKCHCYMHFISLKFVSDF